MVSSIVIMDIQILNVFQILIRQVQKLIDGQLLNFVSLLVET